MTLLLPYGPYAGVNGPLLRVVAAKLSDMGSAKLYDLAVILGASLEESKPIWDQLISEGFIIEVNGEFRPTQKMDDLARARFGNPLARAKADSIVKKAVAAAKKLNSLPSDAPYFWVTHLVVFGSYLDADKMELGDLDLAWAVEERPGVRSHAHMSIIYNRDELQTTRAKIMPKSPYVRLISLSDLLDLNCQYRVLYFFESQDLIESRSNRRAEFEKNQEAINKALNILTDF